MSEQQEVYATDDYRMEAAWRPAALAVDDEIDDLVEAGEADAIIQRAADLLTLAEWPTNRRALEIFYNGDKLCVVLDGAKDPPRVYEGERAIAEAAAFVRGGGG